MIRILSIGRNTEKKGHVYLLEACRLLAAKEIDFDCTIVAGPSAQAEWVESGLLESMGISERIEVLGDRNEAQILELYRTSDIFALACVVAENGDQDGMPNVLLEAMACGVPVVTTPVAGIPELVEDGKNGYLVPQRDSESLAEAIEKMLDPELRQRLGRSGRETVQGEFDIRATSSKLAQFMQAVTFEMTGRQSASGV